MTSRIQQWGRQAWLWLFILVLIGAALLYYIFGTSPVPDSQEQRNDRAAIKDCWQRHANSPLSPTELKYVAEACEFMENEFILKYRQDP
ncbi:hypothetical protein LG198_12000 [Methylobacillus arboreus]|uniref:hypothetical protein n=1 Tax=Methylobacillus arboreus TaxID=755170 RepID=UPI001E4807D6|nr:hypothetical protein [Methylobacillus arboreus]MCB5191451.1 hypothetical protein [Methylobacillus arboreus]